MSRTWNVLVKAAIAVVVVGLTFGASQLRGSAMVCMVESPGLCPPFDDFICNEWCANNNHTGGACEPAPGGEICCNCWTR
jgi:hypothetical protein